MSSNLNKNINAYILAGGKSSRMGTDKGLMEIEGKAMIQFIIKQLQTVFEKIVIVSNNSDYKKFGLELIPDLIHDFGPAGGIYSFLKHSDKKLNFVVSCDMPFISYEGIDFVIENIKNEQIILIENQGKVEPLFGIYSKECTALWLELMNQNKIKLQDMVTHFDIKYLQKNETIFKVNFFKNINTPTDFEIAVKLI